MELAPRPFTQPSLARLPLNTPKRAEILAAHEQAVAADEDGYDDPLTGHFVFTAVYLASRDCCDLGCRHCPYCD